MCQFDHENVIKLYGVVTETPRMIVLEYMSRGDLSNLLKKLKSSLVTIISYIVYNELHFTVTGKFIQSYQLFC